MSDLRRARLRYRFTSDHERARRLAAERLTDPLSPLDAEWLAAHLAACEECAAVADGYERDALALRAARDATPPMPRDLWARTAAALDAEERRAAGSRSSAFAGGGRRGPASLAPYGVLAAAVVVAVVVGSTLLSTGGPVAPTVTTPLPSAAAIPTPLPVEAANVAWFAPQDDGTYALNIAAVADVCPAGAEGCAPVDGSSRQQLRLSAAPRAVLRSPAGSQLAVVDAATKTVGGTIYMVRLPASQAPATTAPSPSPTIIPIASAPPSPSSGPSEVVAGTPSPSPSEPVAASPKPSPSTSTRGSTSPPASPSSSTATPPTPSPSPSPAASASDGSALAIATGIVVVGETMAYSPDSAWFAFTARPADGSTGTDIWVWHVGDTLARPVTTDHRSVFASWLGDLVLGSRAQPEATAGTTDGTTAPGGSDGTLGSAPGATQSAVPPEPTAMPEPIATPEPTPTLEPSGENVPSLPSGSPETAGASGVPGGSPSPIGPVAMPVSFLLDPASGGRADLAVPGWRPVVDPSGRWVVYWSGRLTLDPATITWVPLDGGFAIAPWAVFAGMASSDGTFVLPPLPSLPALSDGTAATDGTAGVPALPSEPDVAPATPAPTLLEPALTAPLPPSSESPAQLPSGTDESPEASVPPGGPSGSVASPSPTPFPLLVAPEPLPGVSGGDGLGGLPTDWEVRWDPSGDHLALWVGDPVDPRLGRLSLLAVDPPTGRVDLDNSLLRDEPALGGISLDEGRLAWATPPGQDGQGSRLQILAWGDAGSGQLDGQPVSGQATVVVVR